MSCSRPYPRHRVPHLVIYPSHLSILSLDHRSSICLPFLSSLAVALRWPIASPPVTSTAHRPHHIHPHTTFYTVLPLLSSVCPSLSSPLSKLPPLFPLPLEIAAVTRYRTRVTTFISSPSFHFASPLALSWPLALTTSSCPSAVVLTVPHHRPCQSPSHFSAVVSTSVSATLVPHKHPSASSPAQLYLPRHVTWKPPCTISLPPWYKPPCLRPCGRSEPSFPPLSMIAWSNMSSTNPNPKSIFSYLYAGPVCQSTLVKP